MDGHKKKPAVLPKMLDVGWERVAHMAAGGAENACLLIWML